MTPTRRTLLIVEDHAHTRKLMRVALAREGYAVHEARDGASALLAMREQRIEIVLLDRYLPDCDGLQLMQQLRALPASESLRLILLAGVVSDADAARIAMSGCDDIVAKPVDPARLLVAVERIDRALELVELGSLPANDQLTTGDGGRYGALLRQNVALSAEVRILRALSEAVLDREEVEDALVTAVAACFDATHSSLGALYLLDRHAHRRMSPLGVNDSRDIVELATFFGHDGFLSQLIEDGRPQTLLAGTPLPSAPALLARARATTGVVVPLIHLGQPLGALFWALREGHPPELELEHCKSFLLEVGKQVTHALALAEVFRARAVAEREAEQQRRLAREQTAIFRALVECAPDVVMRLDHSGRVRFINRAPDGVALEHVRDSSWFELMAPEQRESMRAALSAVLSRGEPQAIETRMVRGDGRELFIESHLGAVLSGGEIIGAVVIQRDVSLKKQTEAQLFVSDRMASLGTLASGVAHELNIPLASVTGNLDLALREVRALGAKVSPDLSDELHDARKAAERVRRIVHDLKVFSIDEGGTGPVDIEHVLESALRIAENEVRHRARLVRVYQSVPPVDGNQARLGQMFLNLILNAVQAIEEGEAERNELRIGLMEDAQGRVVVSIADTARGDAAAVRARAFAPTATSEVAGAASAAGLSMCERIATSVGGTIVFSTNGSVGGEFLITLPPCAAVREDAPSKRRSGFMRSPRRGRIMVIDDDLLITQVVRRSLVEEHDVSVFDRAEVALQKLKQGERFDVILCDVMMPQMSGIDFYRALSRVEPEQAERVVFFTGGAFTGRAREFLEQIPNRRLDKPVDPEDLRGLVNALVR